MAYPRFSHFAATMMLVHTFGKLYPLHIGDGRTAKRDEVSRTASLRNRHKTDTIIKKEFTTGNGKRRQGATKKRLKPLQHQG